jgi:hypothetical protein
MTPQRAAEIGQQISDTVNFDSNGSWAHVDYNSTLDWAQKLLARVTVLVGEQKVSYSSGAVETTNDGAAGDIVVFGANSIVRATFRANRGHDGNLVLDAEVWAEPRSNLVKMKAKMTSPTDDTTSGEWPRRLEAVAVFSDGTELSLPRARTPALASNVGLAAFLFDPFVHL